MNKSIFLLLTLFIFASCDSKENSSCTKHEKTNTSTIDIGKNADQDIINSLPFSERSFLMGTAGYVPAHFPDSTIDDWQALLDKGAALYGGVFGVHVSPQTEKINDKCLVLEQMRMAHQDVKNVIPYLLLGYSHVTHTPFTDALGKELVDVAKANALKYKPIYFGIGNEINSFYVHTPDSYDLYEHYIIEALKEVKKVSPNSITFTNFQLDVMKGQSDLTGASHTPHWELIDAVEDVVDAIAFTAYPHLHHKNVEDIPSDYLDEIREHTQLPIIITETGWPTIDTASEVVGSDEKQIDFMQLIAEQANNIDVKALIWVLPHDGAFGDGGGVFDNISLFTIDDEAKPAYEYWKAIHATPLHW